MPSKPNSLEQLDEFIMDAGNDRFRKLDGELFYYGLHGEGDDKAAVFINTKLMAKTQNLKRIHCDGTFKVRPSTPKMSQVFILLGIFHGTALPLVFGFMKSRKTECYQAIFGCIMFNFPDFLPKTCVSDYEKAIHASLKLSFPLIIHVGCFFHYAQAILRKARAERIDMNVPSEAQKFVRMLMAAALLPADKIEGEAGALAVLAVHKSSTPELVNDNKVEIVWNYYKNFWVAKITPERFCVEGQDARTNNCGEGFNHGFTDKVGTHSNPWEVIDGIHTVFATANASHDSLATGQTVAATPRCVWLSNDTNIRMKQAQVKTQGPGSCTVLEFLESMAYRAGSVVHIPPADISDEYLTEEDMGPLDIGVPDEPENVGGEVAQQGPANATARGTGRGASRARVGNGRGRGRGGTAGLV